MVLAAEVCGAQQLCSSLCLGEADGHSSSDLTLSDMQHCNLDDRGTRKNWNKLQPTKTLTDSSQFLKLILDLNRAELAGKDR